MSSDELSENVGTTSDLSSLYRRIAKKKCCSEWLVNPQEFYTWYHTRLEKQKGRCAYCNLYGNTKESGYRKWFRGGRRGQRLEVDRIKSDGEYSSDNCVLACYPCNNAKSDVFSYEEFLEIGKTIHSVKLATKSDRASD